MLIAANAMYETYLRVEKKEFYHILIGNTNLEIDTKNQSLRMPSQVQKDALKSSSWSHM